VKAGGAKRGRKPMYSGQSCSTVGCGKPVVAKGFCSNHYRSMHRQQQAKQVAFPSQTVRADGPLSNVVVPAETEANVGYEPKATLSF
jgi:hypothetical protein